MESREGHSLTDDRKQKGNVGCNGGRLDDARSVERKISSCSRQHRVEVAHMKGPIRRLNKIFIWQRRCLRYFQLLR